MNETELRRRIAAARMPGEDGAELRAWATVRAAYETREQLPAGRRIPLRPLAAVAAVAVAVAVAVSPAGPAVGGWIRDTIGRERVVGVRPARPALVSLAAPGQLLVASRTGVWVVNQDGSRRQVGAYDGAAWSPRGLFVVAWRGRQVVALDPDRTGAVHWSLSRERIGGATWSPSGFRVAYLSGSSLRVVAGDGTGDGELAARAAPVVPAWKPGARHVLAYADPSGGVEVVDADTAAGLWRTPRGERPIRLEWTGDGRQLLVASRHALRFFEAPRRLITSIEIPSQLVATAAAVRPRSHDAAYAVFSGQAGRGSVFLYDGSSSRLLFSGSGRFDDLVWSPDGRFVLVGWAAADEWVFIPGQSGPRVRANADIARQFDPGSRLPPAFSRVEGWCCA